MSDSRRPPPITEADRYKMQYDEMRRDELGGMRLAALVFITAPFGLALLVWLGYLLCKWVHN